MKDKILLFLNKLFSQIIIKDDLSDEFIDIVNDVVHFDKSSDYISDTITEFY